MKNDEKYKDLKHNRFTLKLYGILCFAGIFGAVVAFYGVYVFKSWNPDVVARRFIFHNEKISLEVGGVDRIDGFGVVSQEPSRSKKIAIGIKSGEPLSEILKDTEVDSRTMHLKTDGNGSWKNGHAFGKEKVVEIEIYLEKHFVFEDYIRSPYYIVTKAKYRENEGNWQEIQIGWFENSLALFY